MRWVAAALLAFTFVSLACGDGSSRTASASCTNEATAEAVRAAHADGDWMTPGVHLQVDDETHCRLRRALLTLDDMPEGWRNSRFSFTGNLTDHIGQLVSSHECGGVPAYRLTAGLEGSYETDSESMRAPEWRSVSQFLLAFQEGAAERFVDAVRHSCTLMEGTRGDVYGLIRDVADGSSGDDSLLVRGEISFDDEASREIPWTMSLLRRDDLVSVITAMGPALEAEQFNSIVENRIDKIGALPEATPVPNEGCFPAAEPTPGPGSEILRDALIELDDMEAGWVEAPPEPCGLLGMENSCAAEQTGLVSVQPSAEASTGFTRGEDRYLRQNIGLFQSDDVERVFTSMGEWIGDKQACVLTLQDEKLTLRFRPAPLPEESDDAYAWYLVTEGLSQFDELLVYAVQFKRGNVIVRLQHAAMVFGGLPPGEQRANDEYLQWRIEAMAGYVQIAEQKLAEIEDDLMDLE